MLILLILNKYHKFCIIFIVHFEQVNTRLFTINLKKPNLLIKYQLYTKLNLLIKYQLYRKLLDIISTIYIYNTKNSIYYHLFSIIMMPFTLKKSVGIYLLNVNNENNKTWSIIYWKFKRHSKVVLMFLLLIFNKCQIFSIVFIVDFEQLNTRLMM